MRLLAAIAVMGVIGAAVSACEPPPPPELTQGRWVGNVVPLGHPDQRSEIYLRVQYAPEGLTILVGREGEESRIARDIQLTADSLHFVYDDLEGENVLKCGLGLQPNGSYEGPCAGGGGESSYFMMRPPDPASGQEA
ncbi:MAG: hypothetical protein WBW88_03935 [Rhodothermales bacterium]|jgi:hypothetical protein